MKTNNYWRTYYDEELVEQSDNMREEVEITSTGVQIHVDVYAHPNPEAPVVIFNHGAAGYCRLFVPLALSFARRGYTVLLPDQRGQGFSGGRRGDYTVSECVQNIVDVAAWARKRFAGPLFMAGGSVGGALTYYAAAAGASVDAVACLNLFDFGNGADGISISRLAFFAQHAQQRFFLALDTDEHGRKDKSQRRQAAEQALEQQRPSDAPKDGRQV